MKVKHCCTCSHPMGKQDYNYICQTCREIKKSKKAKLPIAYCHSCGETMTEEDRYYTCNDCREKKNPPTIFHASYEVEKAIHPSTLLSTLDFAVQTKDEEWVNDLVRRIRTIPQYKNLFSVPQLENLMDIALVVNDPDWAKEIYEHLFKRKNEQ